MLLSGGEKREDYCQCRRDGQACVSIRDDPTRPCGNTFLEKVRTPFHVRPVSVESEPRDEHDTVEEQHTGGGVGVASPYRRREWGEHDERQEENVATVQHRVGIGNVLKLPPIVIEQEAQQGGCQEIADEFTYDAHERCDECLIRMLHEPDEKLRPEERHGDGEDAVDERLQPALISRLKLHLRLCEFRFHLFFGHIRSCVVTSYWR